MERYSRGFINISYLLSLLFIVVLFIFLGFSFYQEYRDLVSLEEERVFKELSYQGQIIDNQMAEIIDRGKLQKLWIEELQGSDIESVRIEDYDWEYDEDLNVSYLVQTDERLGGIYILGKMENMSVEQAMTVKRMLASFSVRAFMIKHVEFTSGAIYYSDDDIISIYPYTEVDELFEGDSVASTEIFDYIGENIEMLKTEGSENDYTVGWESNLNPDVYGNGIIYTRNWTMIIDDEISGIYQATAGLDPLDHLIDMNYEGDYLYVVDLAGQLAYDNDKAPEGIERFDLFALEEIEVFDENPYGQGLYRKDDDSLTYVMPLENTNWRIIYQIDRGVLSSGLGRSLLHYIVYFVLAIIMGGVLLSLVHQANVKRKMEEDKLIKSSQMDYLTGRRYCLSIRWRRICNLVGRQFHEIIYGYL